MPHYVPTFTMTLTDPQATSLIVALRRSLEAYDKNITPLDSAHPESCIGVQQMLIRELEHAQYGRRTDFVKTKMSANTNRE